MLKPSHYPKIKVIYILLLTTVWSLYAYSKGVLIAPDSIRYSGFADILIEHNFSFFKYLELAHFSNYPPLFNYNWVTIVAMIKLLFGENWGLGIVILNLSIGIFFATLLLKTTWSVTGKPACAIFAGIMLLLLCDFYLWIPWALSDIFFACLCFAILLLTIGLYQQRSKPLKRVVGIGVLFYLALLCRPTFPPLLIFVILSIPMFFFFSLKATDARERHNFIIRLALLAGILIPVTIIYHSYIMIHPEKWPFSFLSESIAYSSGVVYKKGIVLWAAPETFHSAPSTILDCALMTLHKLFAYFVIAIPSYSLNHTLFNYATYLPVYGLCIWATASLFKKDNGPSPENWWSIFSCALLIFLFAFFHSMQEIDGDFRYILPIRLPLILLAALGLNELINRFSKRT